MKLSCDREALNSALQAVLPAVPQRPSFPILGNVLVEAGDKAMCLTADNQALRIRKCLPAEVERPGRAAIPARLVTEFAAALDEHTVVMALDESSKTLRLECGHLRSRITAADVDDFPASEQAPNIYSANFDRDSLLEAIEQVRIAVSKEASRPVLTGVLFSAKGRHVTLAACDGYRLGERLVEAATSRGAKVAAIVPEKALTALHRLFRGEATEIQFSTPVTPGVARFSCGDAELQTSLLAGTFPDYRSIIPRNLPTSARVLVTPFLTRLRAISVFAQDEAHQATVSTSPNSLTVRAAAQDLGDAQLDIAAVTSGPPTAATINAGFLIDVLAAIGDPSADLYLGLAPAPLMVKPTGGLPYTYVMMQVRPVHA